MYTNIKYIIWDWNGTLLDDTRLCVEIMNELLEKRNLPKITKEIYLEVFTFPVKEYYTKIGFDFTTEPFEIPAIEFIEKYNQRVLSCFLHADAIEVLNYFKNEGVRQFILSAMHQEILDNCIQNFGISRYFESISGLDNHYAVSKSKNGEKLISDFGINNQNLMFIGDTCHDSEVAEILSCKCTLVANGHQSENVLRKTGAIVLNNLLELIY